MNLREEIREMLGIKEEIMHKSINELLDDVIEKANGYGNKIPVKKETADGRMITYWLSPEDLNAGKNRGQQNLFDIDDSQKASNNDYFANWDKQTYASQIKPLISKMKEVEDDYKGLSARIENKYANYKWDRDTRDLDIQLDYDTLAYMNRCKLHPEHKQEYYKDYLQETDRNCKKLNNRKLAMARLKVGSEVIYNGEKTTIKSISKRGYPVISTKNGDKTCFVDEIADIDALIEKFAMAA